MGLRDLLTPVCGVQSQAWYLNAYQSGSAGLPSRALWTLERAEPREVNSPRVLRAVKAKMKSCSWACLMAGVWRALGDRYQHERSLYSKRLSWIFSSPGHLECLTEEVPDALVEFSS